MTQQIDVEEAMARVNAIADDLDGLKTATEKYKSFIEEKKTQLRGNNDIINSLLDCMQRETENIRTIMDVQSEIVETVKEYSDKAAEAVDTGMLQSFMKDD